MHDFLADLKLISDSIPVLLWHVLEKDLLTGYFVLNHVSSRMQSCTIAD